MLGIGASVAALPGIESRLDFIQRYAASSAERLAALRSQPQSWWEGEKRFFDTTRSRAWVVVRRIAHTSHQRGQQMAMLRMLNRDLHSNYGPTSDTGGLMKNHAPVVYAYPDLETAEVVGPCLAVARRRDHASWPLAAGDDR